MYIHEYPSGNYLVQLWCTINVKVISRSDSETATQSLIPKLHATIGLTFNGFRRGIDFGGSAE